MRAPRPTYLDFVPQHRSLLGDRPSPEDRPSTQHTPSHLGIAPHVSGIHDHSAGDRGLGAHDGVAADDGIGADARPGGHARAVSDETGTLDPGRGIDVGVLAHPDSRPYLEAGQLYVHPPIEDVELGLQEGIDVPYVRPVGVGDVAEDRQPLVEHGRKELCGEVTRLPRRDEVQHVRLQDIDAGVDRVGENLPPRRLLEKTLDAAILAGHHDAELERVVHALEDERGGRFAGTVVVDDLGDVDVGQGVSGQHHEGTRKHVARAQNGARGAHRHLLSGIGKRHA